MAPRPSRTSGPSSPDSPSRARRTTWIAAALLAAGVLVIYAGTLTNGFIVGYDDSVYVLANEHVQRGLTFAGVGWACTTIHAANWHPLTWISHMTDVQLFGLAPWGHHLTNVLLHAANVLLLFWVLVRATGSVWRSCFVAAMFAVHPLHVESVAWIAERKDVLSGLFWMLTCAAYLRYARAPGPRRYALVVVAFAFGLLAKPMLVSLPLVLLLLDFWPLGRIAPGGSTNWAKLLAEKAPLFALAAASSIVTLVAQRRGGAVAAVLDLPFPARLANAAMSYLDYLWSTLWPQGLAAYYPYVEGRALWRPLVAGGALVAVTAVIVWLARRRQYLATGWFWFLVTLVPVIGLVQVGAQARADRYMYLPSIGLFLLIAWGVPDVLGGFALGRRARAALTAAALAAVLILAASAMAQARSWRDAVTLWTHAVARTSDNSFAQINLAAALDHEGRVAEALPHYAEAIRIQPDDVQARSDYGGALARLGRFADARRELQEAIRRAPRDANTLFNLGFVELQDSRFESAVADFSAVLALAPQDQRARLNLVAARKRLALEQGRRGAFEDAADNLEQALRVDPNDVDARVNLGGTRSRQGRYADARREYEAALAIDPRSPAAHAALAAALFRLELYPEAWRHIELCREYGGRPPDNLVAALTQRMPEPR